MRFLFSIIVLITLVPTLLAQDKDSISSKKLHEIEVSATLKPSTSQSATPLQVFTESDILKKGIQSVADAVKRFNGVVLKDYGGIGGLKTVSIRGMGAEYTAVSYDGMMVNNLQAGQVDIGRFTLDNVSLISLSIGQADDIFLSAKTFSSAGILNLQTKRPEFIKGRHTLHTKVSAGSFGYFEPMIDYGYKFNNSIALSANIDWQRADGNYPFTSTDREDRKRRNSDINIFRSEVNLYTKLSDNDLLDIKLYFFNSERGLPGAVIYDSDIANERLWDKNAFAQITYNKKISNQWKFKSIAKYDYIYNKYKENKYNGVQDRHSKYKQNEIYWSNILKYDISTKFGLSLSQDLIYNSLRSKFSHFDESKKEPDRYNSFTSLATQYKTDRLTITASGLFSFLKETSKNNKGKAYYRRLSPAMSISYKPFETNLRFRASYKHLYRIPTVNELYFVATGKQLNAESSSQYNVGGTWVASINNTPFEYINLSVDAYYNDVKDKIVIQPTMYLPKSYNLGKVDMKGVDAKVSSNVKIVDNINLDILGVYSYLQARDMTKITKEGLNNPTYKHQLIYTPKHSGSASLTINNPWCNITYSALFSGVRYSEKDNNVKDHEVKGYTDHSITLFKELDIKTFKLYASGTISNLWNKDYEIIAQYPMPRRAFRITAGLKF